MCLAARILLQCLPHRLLPMCGCLLFCRESKMCLAARILLQCLPHRLLPMCGCLLFCRESKMCLAARILLQCLPHRLLPMCGCLLFCRESKMCLAASILLLLTHQHILYTTDADVVHVFILLAFVYINTAEAYYGQFVLFAPLDHFANWLLVG